MDPNYTTSDEEIDAASDEEVDETHLRRKRGFRNIDLYKGNKIKLARVQGTEYINYRGNVVRARKLGPPCRY